MKVDKQTYVNQTKVSNIKRLIKLKRIVIYDETFLIECRLKNAKQIAQDIIDLMKQQSFYFEIYCVVTDRLRTYKYNRVYSDNNTTLNIIESYYNATKDLPNLLVFHYGIRFSKQSDKNILELFNISGENQNIPKPNGIIWPDSK